MSSFTFGFNYGRSKKAGGGYDADASTFFTAASITDTTQKSAVNQLVLDLKSYNIWTKMKAIYPVVGGTASAHAVNLKTPGTYNLTFATGMTHSSTGMISNGTTGYGNTNFNPVTASLSYNNNHLTFYSRTSTGNTTYDMGSGDNVNGGTSLFVYRTNTTAGYDSGTATANRLAWSGLNGLGFFLGTSRNPDGKVFRSGTQLQSKNPLTNVSMQSYNFYLCGFNEMNTNTYYSNKQCAFASIGDGLTDTEAANMYTAVQAYQTTLSRNV